MDRPEASAIYFRQQAEGRDKTPHSLYICLSRYVSPAGTAG